MRPRKFGWLILFVVVLLLMVFVPVALGANPLQDDIPPIVTQPQGLTIILTNLTKAVGIGFVVSFLFKHPGWFVGLATKTKWWIIFGLSLGLPIAAQLLLDFVPPQVLEVLNPYWTALSWGFICWAASQVSFEKLIVPARAARAAQEEGG